MGYWDLNSGPHTDFNVVASPQFLSISVTLVLVLQVLLVPKCLWPQKYFCPHKCQFSSGLTLLVVLIIVAKDYFSKISDAILLMLSLVTSLASSPLNLPTVHCGTCNFTATLPSPQPMARTLQKICDSHMYVFFI